jgi:cytoskeleton protein RodZ
MLTSRHLGSATSPVACPRCGSELVAPARSGDASEYVFQLRDGSAPAARADAFDEWLCRSCGQRWPHETLYARATADPAGPSSDAAMPDDLMPLIDLPEVSGSAGVTSPRVARELRAAREGRGLRLSDAANATRIWERYLAALEANAPLEEFPAPAYARFFLRSYAEFLGIEPDTIVNEFDQDHPVEEQPVLRTVPYARPRRRGIAGALVFLSVLALGALVVVRLQQGRPNEPRLPAAAAATEDTSQPGPTSSVTQAPPAPVVDHLRAVVRVNVRSYVEVTGDGEALTPSGVVLEAGQHAVYKADRRLQILLGNAGGVELEVNGDPVTTGSAGSVVTLAIKLKDGEIVTRTL